MGRKLGVVLSVAVSALAAPAAASASILSFTVTSTADETTTGDGCSLREALAAANAAAGTGDCPGTPSAASVVNLPAGHYKLTIAPAGQDDNSTGDLNITTTTSDVTIQGAGARMTVIDGNGLDRVLTVGTPSTAPVVTVDNVTITGGRAPDGPAFANGGGILNFGTLTISNSTISGNQSGSGYDNGCTNCLAGSAGGGGGISNFGSMTMTLPPTQMGSLQVVNSTISANKTGNGGSDVTGTAGAGGEGAGIESLTPLTVSDSTITGNATGNGGTGPNGGSNGGDGGGILSAGTTTISNSTIAGNTVGTGANANGTTGGLDQANGTLTVTDTLLASNASGNCGGTTGDGGHNLSFPAGDASCPNAFLSGDPKLGILADNGGPTDTMALGTGSTAIDQVPATGAGCAATDQRGISRPQGPACDIGAYEKGAAPPTLTPSSLAFPLSPAAAQAVGTIGPAQLVTVTQPSTSGTATVTNVHVSGPNAADFLISADGCTGQQLTGAGASRSCQVAVRFAPGTTGAETATLNVSDTNSGIASTEMTSLSGAGGTQSTPPRPPLIALFSEVHYQATTGHTVLLSYFTTDTASVTITIRRGRKTIAVLHRTAAPGRNTIRWSARIGGKPLPAGQYQLDLTATNSGRTAKDRAVVQLLKAPTKRRSRRR